MVLKLAHDDLGHNGSARTYMIVRRNYYWKGLRPDVVHYVKRCTICRKYNSASPKYNKGTFQAPGAPMDFISMDLIGEFHPPSTHGNKYALTVICMLSGWTWCIPIPDKTAPVFIQAYLRHVHHIFGPSRKILSDNGTEFSNKLFENVAKELGVEHKIYSPPCWGITRIHRLPSRPSHPYGRQPHSLIFMITLYKASSRLPASS